MKDPIDTAFMFWSITMGILIGTRSYIISLIVVALISAIMILLSFVRMRTNENYLLVLHYDPAAEQETLTRSCTGASRPTGSAARPSPARALR